MTSISSIASNLANHIANELSFDRQKGDTIRFGLEIILETIIKAVVILTISYLLGIMPYVLAIFATSMTLRMLSGGAHFKTYGRCLTFSLITSICISYVALAVAPLVAITGILFIVVAFALVGFYFVNRWAPADNPNKPIKSKEKREIYKMLSELYIPLWASTITISAFSLWQTPSLLALLLASAGGFILQLLSIAPTSYRLAGFVDNQLDKLSEWGR
jgi:accessory gene regulator B